MNNVEKRIQRLAQKTSRATSTVTKVWESALQVPPAELVTWFHGDLHPENVLVEDGELTGVIDWADTAAGDSATDLGLHLDVAFDRGRSRICEGRVRQCFRRHLVTVP